MANTPTARDLAPLVAAVILIHVSRAIAGATRSRERARLTGLCVTLAAGRLLYNLFLHPLRGYPGPPSWAASPMPKAMHVLMGTYGRKTVEFHGIYGPTVRVAPGELAFIGAQARLDTLARSSNDELVKDTRFLGVNIHDGYGIVTAPLDVHPRMRRLFVHALNSASIQTQGELVVVRHVNSMIDKMYDVCRGDGVLDMVDLLNFVVYDAMSELTFGETLKLLETGDNIPWMRIMVGARKFIVFRAIFLDIPFIGRLLEALTAGPMRKRMREHCRLSEDFVNRRLARGKGGKPDVWGHVMKHSGSPRGLTKGEMYANGAMFPLAGESSGVVMTGTLYYVLTNPIVYAKLTQEIRSAFSTSVDILVDAVSRLTYLNAVIQEGMRVYPPGAVGISRFASPGGTEISGKVVPEGTLVTWNVYAACTSPAHFHRPREFLPERWLEPRDPEFEADCREVHEPFSRGSRSCIGKRLAMLEMRMVLAKVLWHFDLELCAGMEGWLDQKSYLTWEKGPLMMRVSRAARS